MFYKSEPPQGPESGRLGVGDELIYFYLRGAYRSVFRILQHSTDAPGGSLSLGTVTG